MNNEVSLAPWPATPEELVRVQETLRGQVVPRWRPAHEPPLVGGCFVCFRRGRSRLGTAGEPAWSAAALLGERGVVATVPFRGVAGAPYRAGLLALREGAVLEAAVRRLPELPEVLLADASGRDHPRRAGLALHLGAVLGLPTIGVTHRPLVARGDWPPDERGARSLLLLGEEVVGYWVRTRAGARPLAVHAAWRTDAETAAEIVLSVTRRRTPEPLRAARQAARRARAADW